MALDLSDPSVLLFGCASHIAALLGCTVRTAQRYKSGKLPLPPAAKKLLQLHYGDLSAVLGPDWKGFHLGQDSKLYAPLFHRGMTALQLQGLFFEHQEVKHLRQEVKRLQAALELAIAAGQVYAVMRQAYEREKHD